MSLPDGKPVCSCGIHKLSNLSLSSQRKGESSENEKWNKLENGSLAYFLYCTDRHKRKWPEDVRTQGPWCRPAEPFWARWNQESNGVCKLLSGDFYLTTPCPELSLPSRVPRAAVTNTSWLPRLAEWIWRGFCVWTFVKTRLGMPWICLGFCMRTTMLLLWICYGFSVLFWACKGGVD